MIIGFSNMIMKDYEKFDEDLIKEFNMYALILSLNIKDSGIRILRHEINGFRQKDIKVSGIYDDTGKLIRREIKKTSCK